MKRISNYFILILFFTSCSHKIQRTGYNIDKSEYKNCELIINKFMIINDSIQKIGEIKLGDSGFSVSCSEIQAIEILKNEACAMNANMINITEENRPDALSSCYRCKAEFYKYKNPDLLSQNPELYKSENVNKRVTQDRNKNTIVGVFAVVIGFTVGYLLF